MIDANYPPKTRDPIGTVQELLEIGISPARYCSCSVPDDKNAGCPYLSARQKRPCEFSFKDKPVEEGGGPRMGGVMIRDSMTGSTNVVEMPCYQYMAVVHNHRAYDPPNLFEWAYSEGETFYTKGSEEQVVDDGTGKKHVVVVPKLFERVVPTFPRPKDNPILKEELHSDNLMEQMARKNALRRLAPQLGAAPPDPKFVPAASGLDAELEAITAKARKRA